MNSEAQYSWNFKIWTLQNSFSFRGSTVCKGWCAKRAFDQSGVFDWYWLTMLFQSSEPRFSYLQNEECVSSFVGWLGGLNGIGGAECIAWYLTLWAPFPCVFSRLLAYFWHSSCSIYFSVRNEQIPLGSSFLIFLLDSKHCSSSNSHVVLLVNETLLERFPFQLWKLSLTLLYIHAMIPDLLWKMKWHLTLSPWFVRHCASYFMCSILLLQDRVTLNVCTDSRVPTVS